MYVLTYGMDVQLPCMLQEVETVESSLRVACTHFRVLAQHRTTVFTSRHYFPTRGEVKRFSLFVFRAVSKCSQ